MNLRLESETSDPSFANRQERRAFIRQAQRSPAHPAEVKFRAADRAYHAAEALVNQVFGRDNQSYTDTIYRGDPVLVRWVETLKPLSQAIVELENYDPDSSELEPAKRHNTYTTPVGGVSLADIEQMDLPLSVEDIARINSMFRGRWRLLGAELLREKRAREAILFIGTQPLIRPEVRVNSQLKPLHDRIRSYFDYYLPFMAQPALDEESECQLFNSISWNGPLFQVALATYLPARLGLTPSSAVKMIDQHQYSSTFRGSRFVWWLILTPRTTFRRSLDQAYREDTLPAEVLEYQHFDKDNEQRVTGFLSTAEGGKPTQLTVTPEEILGRLAKYRRHLRSDILSSKEKLIRLKLEDHPYLREIVMTAHNDKAGASYKNALLVVAKFSQIQAHLLLEVTGDQKLYGVPATVLAENPHVDAILADRIIGPILEFAKARFPQVEKEERGVIIPFRPVRSLEVAEPGNGEIDQEEPVKPPKRKWLSLPMLEPQPQLPARVETPLHQFTVIHTREMIADFLGKKYRNQQEIDRIMAAIRRFEYGAKRVKAVREARAKGEDYIVIRSGYRRIILDPLEAERTFALVKIASRGEVYEDIPGLV